MTAGPGHSGDTMVSRPDNELELLFEISQALDQSIDLRDVVSPLLRVLAARLHIIRGALTLLNRETGEISIDASYGLSASQHKRGKYRLGEGVTGYVVETGQAKIVPRISQEPMFLNRTGARAGSAAGDNAFICVPVKLGRETIGALSVELPPSAPRVLEHTGRLLTIISSMIAQAVRLRQSMQEEQERLRNENRRLQEELRDRFRPSNIIGNSNKMQAVYDLIAQVSASDATVLIRGESGTGKELVAHAIHYNSPRADKPFIKVNCAALPETLVESELFGHERGAFTGALSARKGRFELAQGGTIFLDEVGDFSPATQVKLLRVLQEREFERLGGTTTIKVDVRVIAATNRNLEELMERGLFRQDLYYRLNVFPIHIPPLRERKTDILLLADYFIEKYSAANRKNVRRITTPAIDMLMSYHWPGNVRELENCIERAVLLTTDDAIHAHHLPPTLQTAEASNTVFKGTLRTTLETVERDLIIDALKTARGNMAKAARALGITERLMGLRVAKYGIDRRRFRTEL
ncbi:MAG: sigma 54-interacting transcriptional regulator [bacterium]|nr:sigma 54-interacting transcriptional regulator [bacterium]